MFPFIQMTDLCTSALYFAADSNQVSLARLLIHYGGDPCAQYRVRDLPRKCCLTYSDPHPHLEIEPLQCALRNDNFPMIKVTYFYCEKYTYHFLTIAICWCHPTHWPTLRNVLRNLKRPVSECELACSPSGHVTTLVNNLHYFCWPS